MKSEIVSIGTELLLGEITDTNASFIASELPALGIDLYFISQVGDNRLRLIEVLERAWKRSDLVITTGGLGPSEGDITRRCIAEMLGEEIKIDPAIVAQIEARFRRLGRKMPESNLRQAGVIPSASILPNTRGTAPGWWVEKDNHTLIAMPGPPAEMHLMWQNEVLPRLQKKTTEIIHSLTIKTWGLSESAINEIFLPMFSSANPTMALYAKADGIHVRLTAKAKGRKQAEELIAPMEEKVRATLKEHIWGTDQDTFENVVGRNLSERKLTLAVMEGFTSGLLSQTLAGSAHAPSCFNGGIVASAKEALKIFGIGERLSYSEKAEALAQGVRICFHADIGLSVSDLEPVKLEDGASGNINIGIVDIKNGRVVTVNNPRERAEARRWVVSSALFELFKMLDSPDYFLPKGK